MGKEDENIIMKVGDVEEGEISDTASIEEISEEDFNKQDVVVVKPPSSNNETTKQKEQGNGNGRVWTISDLYRYQMVGGHVSGLYNLAWAQAVQSKPGKSNKPLNELFADVVEELDESSKRSSPSSSAASVNSNNKDGDEEKKKVVEKVVIDDNGDEMMDDNNRNKIVDVVEKEEGELEEGEIDLDMEPGEKANNGDVLNMNIDGLEVESGEKGFEKKMNSIRDALESVTIEFVLACTDSSGVSFSSFSEKEKEPLISTVVNKKDNDVNGKSSGHDMSAVNKLPTDSFVNNKANLSIEGPKTGVSSFKSRAALLPLLDLHKDHDADSLPSPTRESALPLPAYRVLTPKMVLDTGNSRMHPYETDALKAVSSYQQKFSKSSFALTDRLPSPTPSEESGNGDGDTGGEVSSSLSVSSFRPANPLTSGQSNASISLPRMDGSSLPGVISIKSAVRASSAPSLTVKASAKSRDPRLRFVNSDSNALDQNHRAVPVVNTLKVEPIGGTMNKKRQKIVDDPIPDGHSLKRQKNALENSGVVRDVKTMVGSGGWLEDTDMVGPQTMNKNQLVDNAESDPRRKDGGGVCTSSSCISSVNISGTEQIPVTGTSVPIGGELVPVKGSTAAIPDLLKNIAVNPTMLINILKMGQQQRLALEAQQKPVDPAKSTTYPLNSNSMLGTVPVVGAAHSGILPRPAGTVQVSPQLGTADDLGKIRMKPRDPRRVLHNNALQRNGSMGSEHLKTNLTSIPINQETKDNQNLQKQEGQVEKKPVPLQSLALPDISMPFTKNLKNIADIVSVSHASTSQPLVPQNPASQPMRTTISSSDQFLGIGSAPGAAAAAAAGPRTQNAWGDVEHLFEGYNDQQKAAIQRERARRIEEQKKLFSARKLCLVLDLDHTLLNSAKFVEVDPVHDEILRKKEEQDREKAHRHLFRFPHMGMWTKLRPGIWNFLEKASKLYELHLYTMGNKLYATEMAKVLDPTGVLFNGRVISRGDDGEPFDGDERIPKSKDLEGVLGMESGVVIMDDSVRVWPHNKLNLIVVERYIYFPCSRRQFGLPGPSLLEIDHDERPEDGTLACSLAVIERIHQNFFTHPSLDEADVRNILASEQRKILAGCRIVFSRVFPVGEANPHLHPLWQTAEQFGAVCTNQIDEQVTHVVANSLGTDKVNWALSTGRFVVYPGWVEASALLYRRANEQDFAIKP
ncbi:RNA polymerase II ctd phosphatase, putative [Ricinus communis]|uniref:protein-serine/threonine phosphatase n=1 Tax=Ricinus communis TaxID=3988 RepID=B9RFY1_RICCO|nr:RNA polymerase II ctd phosphatase, putative [Ricinus communis]